MSLVEWVLDSAVPGGRIRAGFTSRRGGTSEGAYEGLNLGLHVGDDPSAVARNRLSLTSEVGFITWMDQVHGANVEVVDSRVLTSGTPGRTFADTDGLVVDASLHPCSAAVMVADCVPLLLAASNAPIAAAVHVGRSGLFAGIASVALETMRERGAQGIRAYVGPSICGRCYEVPADMRDEAESLAPGSYSRTSWGTPAIDIPEALELQLRKAGVGNVARSEICTMEDARYYSHRREMTAKRASGRFVGLVQVRRDTPF